MKLVCLLLSVNIGHRFMGYDLIFFTMLNEDYLKRQFFYNDSKVRWSIKKEEKRFLLNGMHFIHTYT